MIIIFKFTNGQNNEIEVQGEIKDFYLALAGIHPEKESEILDIINKIEKRTERKHHSKHKYVSIPFSSESLAEKGIQVLDSKNGFTDIETDIDLAQVLEELTDIQRHCFTEVCISGKTQRGVAKELKKSKSVVTQAIEGLERNLKDITKIYDQSSFPAAIV